MIRVPSTLVGLVTAYTLAVLAFLAANTFGNEQVLVACLPLIAGVGGFISARWADKPAPIPGLAIGVLILAARIGISLGLHDTMFDYLNPIVALLELIAAVTGGLMGTVVMRRLVQQPLPKPDFGTL